MTINRQRRRRLRAGPAIGAFAVAALLAAPAMGIKAAGASSAGLHLVSATSAVNSQNSKSVTVKCPIGEELTGTGAQVSIANTGKAALVSVTPLPGDTAVTAVAAETGGGTTQNWYLKAYGMCVSNAPTYTIVSAISAINSQNKSVSVYCPSGWNAIGSGGQVSTPDTGKVALTEVQALTNLVGVRAIASEVGSGTPNNWYLKAYAICSPPGTPAGLQALAVNSAIDSNHAKSVTVKCPAGTRVIDSMATVVSPDSAHVIIDEITPLPDLSGVTAVGSETAGGTSQKWSIAAQNVCAPL
jgi:hypothetical protein